MFKRKTCTALAVALGLSGTLAFAQQDTHGPGGPMQSQTIPGRCPMMGAGGMPMMGMMRMMMGEGGMPMMAMTGHVEGRLAFLKTELKITEAQMPLWNAFAEAVRDNAKAMGQTMQGAMMGTSQTATPPEKLAVRERTMTAHLEALRKLKTALDPLYAALSDEQKKTADEIMPGPMGMGMMMM
jgi:hypothetical protein